MCTYQGTLLSYCFFTLIISAYICHNHRLIFCWPKVNIPILIPNVITLLLFCVYYLQRGDRLYTSECDVYERQILAHNVDRQVQIMTSKVDLKEWNIYNRHRPRIKLFESSHLWWFQIEESLWSPWFIQTYFSVIRVSWRSPSNTLYIVASELKDPIWHSSEWQIGSFSSEATIWNLQKNQHRKITTPATCTSGYV